MRGQRAEGKEVDERWDAVVVAIGWYDDLVWPETDGLAELRKRGLARHAKWWRGLRGCDGKVSVQVWRWRLFGSHFICRGSLLLATQTLQMRLPPIQHP